MHSCSILTMHWAVAHALILRIPMYFRLSMYLHKFAHVFEFAHEFAINLPMYLSLPIICNKFDNEFKLENYVSFGIPSWGMPQESYWWLNSLYVWEGGRGGGWWGGWTSICGCVWVLVHIIYAWEILVTLVDYSAHQYFLECSILLSYYTLVSQIIIIVLTSSCYWGLCSSAQIAIASTVLLPIGTFSYLTVLV